MFSDIGEKLIKLTGGGGVPHCIKTTIYMSKVNKQTNKKKERKKRRSMQRELLC